MTEVQYMREIENLEAQNRKLKESLTACKLEVNKLRAALLCFKAMMADDRYDVGEVVEEFSQKARAALEGK